MSNRTKNLVVLVLLLVYIGFCGWIIMITRSWIDKPFPGFLVLKSKIVPVFFLEDWEGYKSGIKFSDVVISVKDVPVKNGGEIYNIVL